MKNQNILIPIVVALIVGAVAFFGGMQYQKMQPAQADRAGQRGNFPRGSGPGGLRGGAVIGDIFSIDDKSMTIKLQDGSSKIVLLPDNVTISKTDTGAKTDLKTGIRVGVFGTTNPDGSVTAQNVQLNPMFRMGGPSGSTMPSPR